MIRLADQTEDSVAYLPTPEAIQQACEAIRAAWGPSEEQRRRRWSIPPPVEVSEVCAVEEPLE